MTIIYCVRCVQTYNNVLHVYGLHTSKEQLLTSLGSPLETLRRVHVYLQHSTVLEQHGTHAVDLVCDSRSVLIGFSDASFQLLSWQSQVCIPHCQYEATFCARTQTCIQPSCRITCY